jgi:hypothetical protein
MKIKALLTTLAALVVISTPSLLRADFIPYPNVGTPAPANVFTATSTGDIMAYFYGSDAGYDSTIGLRINNLSTGVTGLPNHGSVQGQSINLGWANAGDLLTFELVVANLGYSWYSDPSLNSDGKNHVYATSFSGSNTIPAGVFIAFEDLPGLGDVDYNDHAFVVTNVSIRKVPDAASTLALGALAIAGLGFLRRRRA